MCIRDRVITILFFYMERKTVFGYESKMTGLNPHFAKYGGVFEKKVMLKTMALSGAIAAVAEMCIRDRDIKELSYLMVGKGIPQRKIEKQEPGKTVLEIEDAYCENDGVTVLKGLSLHVKEGEIVGLAGVSGNGQTELIQCLTGLTNLTKGKITLEGKEISSLGVREIREAGCAHIPEDRYEYGCAKKASLEETAIMRCV